MKNSWKLFLGFLLVGALSAAIGAGTFSYLSNKQDGSIGSGVFSQGGYRAVNYATPAENTDFTYAAEQSVHAVVHIKSVAKSVPGSAASDPGLDLFERFFGQVPRQYQPRVGFGSGVIISSDGYIITNNHVIEGADELQVTMNDGKTFKAKVIGGDDVSDIALIKIDGKDLPVIPFGDSDKLKVGEWVLAVGNPFNLTSTVTAGIVSAKGRGNVFPVYNRRGEDARAQMKVESFIQTDAAVNSGNSGGALVNTKGELVGINTAIYSETGNYAGYSFAVPVSIAQKVAADLKQYGAVQRALLGVDIRNLSAQRELDSKSVENVKVTEGVYVLGFSSGSAAKTAGVEIGDVITSVNGVTVRTISELQEQVSRYNPGEKVKIVVLRGNVEKTFTVELKNQQGSTEIVKNTTPAELLGAVYENLSDAKKKEFGINFGIEVVALSSGKLRDAGVPKGFVILTANDRKVNDVDSFDKIVQTILKQNTDDRGLFIKGISPNGKVQYYAINLNE